MLACSCRKRPSGDSHQANEKLLKAMIMPLGVELKIVVIMAGDDMPPYLAKPVNPLPTCSESTVPAVRRGTIDRATCGMISHLDLVVKPL
ncbi:hypothetical protein NL676_005340, partial [Syzygium grande]